MSHAHDINRRDFLAHAGAFGAFAGGTLSVAAKVLAGAKPYRIDVHHHISPPTWLDAVKRANLDFPPADAWSPDKLIAEMDCAGTAIAVVAPTMPPRPKHRPQDSQQSNKKPHRGNCSGA